MAGSTLPDRVAQLYYTYGLFCSSNPFYAITLAASVLLFCCSPLLNVPLPGNAPTIINVPQFVDKIQNVPHSDCSTGDCTQNKDTPIPLHILLNDTKMPSFLWTKDKPLIYVQQIVMKIGVSPWNTNLKMWDAFRAPLHEAFRLLEAIRNHEEPETKSTLAHHCYQIESIKRRSNKVNIERVLPEYSCLLLSPANLWQQNIQSFSLDANIVNTVLKYQKTMPLAEMAFGMQMRDTGIKRYPLRARPRVLQYAITIFYQNPDERYLQSLTKKLKELYPLYQDSYTRIDDITLIYYPGQFDYTNLIPLLFIFVGVMYVYFSVRKIEFIKSKFALAACAGLTITGSLFMSMGICFYFGFSLSHKGGESLPYLVIILGYENVLVLTKSVTSTDSQLDVKIRLAQGLSKEGWSITKNLLIEITILTLSFFTFVPLIQELAIFMIVSLISDYFIQMVFFATILGIDVRRMEFFQQPDKQLYLKDYFNPYNDSSQIDDDSVEDNSYSSLRMRKSKSHPRLNGLAQKNTSDNVSAHLEARVPKRIRLVNIWARTRFFQRLFMLWMLVWISMIVYNSGIVDYFITNTDKDNAEFHEKREHKNEPNQPLFSLYYNNSQSLYTPLSDLRETNDTITLKHSPHFRPWSRLSAYHWSGILSQYNASVLGRYVVVLPPVLLSHRVAPELAAGLRHPDERDPPPLRWQALAAALDPIDSITDLELIESKNQQQQWGSAAELPIYPTTPMEILLLAILCVISVAVIAYMMVVLYRCVCSRHYAEWRASWSEDDEYKRIIAKQPAVQLVMEALPLVVTGHVQEVECLVSDGEKVVSACLQGNVKVWDSQTGDLLTNIDRYELFNEEKEPLGDTPKESVSSEENKANTSSQHNESLPSIRKNLTDHLSGLRHRAAPQPAHSLLPDCEITNYSFANSFKELYCNEEINESKENVDTNNINLSSQEKGAIKDSQLDDNIILLPTEDNVNNIINNNSKRRLASNSSIERGNNERINAEDKSDGTMSGLSYSPVWCMDFTNDLIIIGCADGRIEFWDAVSGELKCVWRNCGESGRGGGVTHVRMVGAAGARCVCAATLSGRLALLQLHSPRFRATTRRAHKRTGSAGSLQSRYDVANFRLRWTDGANSDKLADSDEVACECIALCRPYQQPITELHSEGERILTGGQDHVLKVFSSRNLNALLTLHGHCGPITSCFIDRATPTIAGSGSQDGFLCVWDLHTGACLYSTQAHNGAVSALAYSASYVVSAGADERLCIWDRFQGNKLNSVPIGLNYMSRMLPLTHTMLVMGDRGGLTVYDLSSGEVIRRVPFGDSDSCIFVRQVLPLNDAIVCDYANQLRIVRFPRISQHRSTKND